MVSAAIEYDDRPGVIRERVIFYQTRLRTELARAIDMAVETGELNEDTDSAQLAFELFGVELAMHHDSRSFGFEQAQRADNARSSASFPPIASSRSPLMFALAVTPQKSTTVRQMVAPTLIRTAFAVGSWIAPRTTIERAADVFCTPSPARHRPPHDPIPR